MISKCLILFDTNVLFTLTTLYVRPFSLVFLLSQTIRSSLLLMHSNSFSQNTSQSFVFIIILCFSIQKTDRKEETKIFFSFHTKSDRKGRKSGIIEKCLLHASDHSYSSLDVYLISDNFLAFVKR